MAINEKKYKPRVVDNIIEKNLKLFGAICIEDPKWCGKTWTSSHHSNREFYVGEPTENFSYRKLAELEPYSVLMEKKHFANPAMACAMLGLTHYYHWR